MNGLLNNPLDRTISAIIGIESGGRWDALGPVIDNPNSRYFGDRAYGVSQVMGRNIPEWTSRYLGRTMTPAEYLADPEAQMSLTRGVIGDWLGQGYSPQEAANLWFTGSANPNANVSDTLGTSASEYQRRFNERFNQPSAMPAGFRRQFDQFFGQRGGQDMGGVISGMSQPAEPQRGGMFRQPEFWENLALAANTLRLEPDQGLAQQIASQREARAAQQGVNRTVEFFQSRGMDELAQLAQIDPVSAMRQYVQMSQPVQAEPIRGVEVGGNLVNPITGEVIYSGGAEPGATQATGAQLMERFGVQNLDPNALFNISPDGKITPVSPGPTTIVTGPQAPSAGAQAIDKAYAERWLEWITTGGPDMGGQLAQLNSVLSDLEKGKPLTGAGVGATAAFGDLAFAIMNPEAANARDLVYDVVQRNLRAVLGAQFTQAEGQQLVNRAYNPALKPEQNAARLRKLVKMMEEAAAANQSMAEYFEKNQTLMGYRGKMITKEDFFNAFPDEGLIVTPESGGTQRLRYDENGNLIQ